MCAPVSRQSVKTEVRLTWRTCGQGVSGRRRLGRKGVVYFVPVIVGELVAWVSSLYAGAIHEDVDSVFVLEDDGEERCDGFLGGEVGAVDSCFPA